LIIFGQNKAMKSKLFFVALMAIILSSCEDDEGSSRNNTSYFNSSVNTSWQYTVEGDDASGVPVSNTETLTVDSSDGTTFTMASNPVVPAGFMSNMLTSGTLEDLPGTLEFTGTVGLDVAEIGNFSIDFVDLPLYDASEPDGSVLYTSLEETISQNFDGIPLTLSYSARSEQVDTMDELNVNGTVYNNVTHSRLLVTLRIVADLQITQIDLLGSQDVVIVDNYFAEEIGLVQSNAVITYQLENIQLPGVTLPFPQTATFQTVQELDVYTPAN
jgi:hypothetical protein